MARSRKRLSSVHPVAICAVLTSDDLHRCRFEACTSHRPPHRMNGCVKCRKIATSLTDIALDRVGRLVAGRRNMLAAVPHASEVTKSEDWHVDHQLTNGGTEIGVDTRQNTRLKNVWPVSARPILDNFPRIKLLAYFEDEPVYPSGPPRRVSGGCTQQNAV
jgi:hypothetical protein